VRRNLSDDTVNQLVATTPLRYLVEAWRQHWMRTLAVMEAVLLIRLMAHSDVNKTSTHLHHLKLSTSLHNQLLHSSKPRNTNWVNVPRCFRFVPCSVTYLSTSDGTLNHTLSYQPHNTMKSSLFCDVTQRRLVKSYGRFGKTYQSNLKWSFPEQKRSHWHRNRILRSRTLLRPYCTHFR
jgi:hypothetical protein